MPKTILIVDDDPDAIEVIKCRLEKTGHKTFSASDGKKALEIAKSESLDLIILDIVLPEMNGAEVDLCLKESEKTKNIPVIFLSGIIESDDEETANLSGPVLRKSADNEVLIDKVNELLSGP